jgi:hypothetical protein
MPPAESRSSAWQPAILAGAIAFGLTAFWPLFPWYPIIVAAAVYFALPARHRTRSNASLIGWSVGFALVFLGEIWRVAH